MDKATIIGNLKKEYPSLKNGSEELGYTDFTPEQYEATILQWADNLLEEAAKAEELSKAEADKAALLAKIGITADEAKLLLS